MSQENRDILPDFELLEYGDQSEARDELAYIDSIERELEQEDSIDLE